MRKMTSKLIAAACVGALATCGVVAPVAGAATADGGSQLTTQSEAVQSLDKPDLVLTVPDDSFGLNDKGKNVRKQSYFKKARTARSLAMCDSPFAVKITLKDKKGCVTCKVGKLKKKTSEHGNVSYSRAINWKVKKGIKKGTYTVKLKASAPATDEYKADSVTATYKLVVK